MISCLSQVLVNHGQSFWAFWAIATPNKNIGFHCKSKAVFFARNIDCHHPEILFHVIYLLWILVIVILHDAPQKTHLHKLAPNWFSVPFFCKKGGGREERRTRKKKSRRRSSSKNSNWSKYLQQQEYQVSSLALSFSFWFWFYCNVSIHTGCWGP